MAAPKELIGMSRHIMDDHSMESDFVHRAIVPQKPLQVNPAPLNIKVPMRKNHAKYQC